MKKEKLCLDTSFFDKKDAARFKNDLSGMKIHRGGSQILMCNPGPLPRKDQDGEQASS